MSSKSETDSGGLEFCSPMDNPEMKYSIAMECASGGDTGRAEKLFLEIIKENTQHYGARIGLGCLYMEQGKLDESIEQNEIATQINPDHPTAFVNLAAAFIQKGDFAAAINECEEALFIDPRHADAYKNLSWAYLEKGDYDRSIFVAGKLLEFEPHSGLAYNNIAVALYYKKDYSKAMDYVKKATKEGFPVHPDFYNDLRERMD